MCCTGCNLTMCLVFLKHLSPSPRCCCVISTWLETQVIRITRAKMPLIWMQLKVATRDVEGMEKRHNGLKPWCWKEWRLFSSVAHHYTNGCISRLCFNLLSIWCTTRIVWSSVPKKNWLAPDCFCIFLWNVHNFRKLKLYQQRPQIAWKFIRDFLQFVSIWFTR